MQVIFSHVFQLSFPILFQRNFRRVPMEVPFNKWTCYDTPIVEDCIKWPTTILYDNETTDIYNQCWMNKYFNFEWCSAILAVQNIIMNVP